MGLSLKIHLARFSSFVQLIGKGAGVGRLVVNVRTCKQSLHIGALKKLELP